MMNSPTIRLAVKLALMIALFFCVWFGLSRVEWVGHFHIRQTRIDLEQKLGELIWDVIRNTEKEITDTRIYQPIDSMFSLICRENGIDRKRIQIHILDSDITNAFALPGKRIVVYSGLIQDCHVPEELCGVMAHELAHIEKGHIMRKLIKETGLQMLITASGGGHSEMIRQALGFLSSKAYDSNHEKEADIASTDYLIRAGMSPEPFAGFMYTLSAKEGNVPDAMYWLNTHPASDQRAKDILDYAARFDKAYTTVMDIEEWDALKPILLKSD